MKRLNTADFDSVIPWFESKHACQINKATEPATPLNNAHHGKLDLQLKLEDAQGFGRPGG